MPFVVQAAGEKFSTADLRLSEAVRIEDETGESWIYINPLRSAKHYTAIVRQFLLRERSAEEAQAILDGIGLNEAIETTEVVDDDLPETYEDGVPKAEAAPSTPTS